MYKYTSLDPTKANLDLWLSDIFTRVDKLEKTNTELLKTIEEQNNEIKLLKENKTPATNPVNFADILKRGDDNKLPKESLNIINLITDEKADVKRRENNIVISGLEEPTGTDDANSKKDNETVRKILDELKINVTIKKNTRLGKKIGNPAKDRPLLITLNDKVQVLPILKAFNKSKEGSNYERIYFNKDLTEAERLKEYNLRQLRKKKNDDLGLSKDKKDYRFCIRNNQIVKVNEKHLKQPMSTNQQNEQED